MPNFYNRQQQERNSLILGLLLSLFIHGAIALILSQYQARKFVSEEESLTPITIVKLTKQQNLETSSDRSSSSISSKSAQNLPAIASPQPPTDPPVNQNSSAIAPLTPSKQPTPPKSPTNSLAKTKPAPTPPTSPAKPSTSPPTPTETPKIEPPTTKPNVPQVTEDKTQVVSTPPTKPERKVNRPTTQPEKPIEDNQPLDKPFENSSLAEKKPLADLDKPAPTQEQPSSKLPLKKRSLDNQKRDPEDSEGIGNKLSL